MEDFRLFVKNWHIFVTSMQIFRIIALCLTKTIKFMIRKIILLTVVFFTTTSMINNNTHELSRTIFSNTELLYDNVWGTIYHAEVRQCDDTPTLTGDKSRINPRSASDHRWIAISQEMLDNEYRARLISPRTTRFNGKIQYGDTVWVESPYSEINGWWVVHDVKNKRYNNSIDFLQTKGDASLYDNNPYWSGKFEDISIYRIKNINYSELKTLAYI